MSGKKYEMDMCNGPLFSKILMYSLPLIASGILQLLFNAADMIVAGQFAGNAALGAVGATSSLINLLINVFIGMSVGANVLVAHFFGAGRKEELGQTVHTSIALSLIGGVVLGIAGFFLASPLLSLMGTPDDILPHAVIYMKIYFIGVPGMLLYNFGSAVLRAVGDTKRPLYFLLFAGVINVFLNLFFVIVMKIGVAGVALATIISQCVSAALVIRCLIKEEGPYHLDPHAVRLHGDKVMRILRVGLPAGFQGAVFSLSNVLIQSSVNSFGSIAVAGNTAAQNLEGFVYNAMNSFHQTALSFTSQNMGAKKMDRVKRIMWICLGCVTVLGLCMGFAGLYFADGLLSFYSKDSQVTAYGYQRLFIILSTYFLCGIMDVMVGSIRGMGYSIMPMVVSLLGACGLRIVWIFTVFAAYRTPTVLYISYPVTWTVTFLVHFVCFIIGYKKKVRMLERK